MLETFIGEKQVDEDSLACPECGKPISFDIIQANISRKELRKYERFMLDAWRPVEGEDIYYQCRGIDCQYKVLLENTIGKFECPMCHHVACPKCYEVPHVGITCEKHKEWKDANEQGDDELERIAREQGWKKCPHCSAWCEKVQGCKFMTCGSGECKKKKYFCYICGVALTVMYMQQADHYTHFFKKPFGEQCKTTHPNG